VHAEQPVEQAAHELLELVYNYPVTHAVQTVGPAVVHVEHGEVQAVHDVVPPLSVNPLLHAEQVASVYV